MNEKFEDEKSWREETLSVRNLLLYVAFIFTAIVMYNMRQGDDIFPSVISGYLV